ncbi:MAG: tRNA (adenosine(37)-N6)-dimethylallyltransferase MiaA [bacterium]
MASDASGPAEMPEIAVICGPTAAGKSAVAMWLASRATCTIISADSRQVYCGFDIGSAKPSLAERAAVAHRGIDIIDPTERYSAAAWADAADGWINESRRSHAVPLVVGGTGLYLRALFEGLFHEPPLDPTRRDSIASVIGAFDLDELRRWVTCLDPARANLGRTQLLRAIEMALLSGHRMSDLHRDRARVARWRPRYLVVDPGPALADRIGARIDDMLEHGWSDEVRRLMDIVPASAPAWKATGYDAVRRLIDGSVSRAQARETILIETRQYAKRQRTWFRHQLPAAGVTRLDPTTADWQTAAAEWMAGVPHPSGRPA